MRATLSVHALLLPAITGLAVLATPARAQSAALGPEDMLTRADANGDGDVAWDEVVGLRTQIFDRLDRDGDGVINQNDRPPRALAARFDRAFATVKTQFDADGDAEVTRNELINGPAPLFEAGDVDGDTVLSAEEIAALSSAP